MEQENLHDGSGERARRETQTALDAALKEKAALAERGGLGEDVVEEMKNVIERIRKFQGDLGDINAADIGS